MIPFFSRNSILSSLISKSIYSKQGFQFWWSFWYSFAPYFFFSDPWIWPLFSPKFKFFMYGFKKHLLDPRNPILVIILIVNSPKSFFRTPEFDPFFPRNSIFSCTVSKNNYTSQRIQFWCSFSPSGHLFFFSDPEFDPFFSEIQFCQQRGWVYNYLEREMKQII